MRGLKRELSLLDMTMLGLGAIIGSGWLYASQLAANLAGPAAIVSWLIGGVAVIFIALVYAEMGAMLPEAGGMVRYPQYSHGGFVGFLMAFACIVAYSTVVAIEAEAVVQYMNSYWPGLYAHGTMTGLGWFMTLVFLVIFFLLNYFSVKIFAKVNTVVTLLKFITPALTVIVLLAFFHPANLSFGGNFAPFGVPGILSAVSSGGIMFAFLGFRQAVDMAGEAKNPSRNVPLAIILAVLIGIVLYVLLQVTFLGALTPATLSKGWGHLGLSAPFLDVAKLLGLSWLAVILAGDALLSPAGTGNIYTASTSRLVLAQANNGFWWRIFKSVNEKSGVPRPALVLTFLLAVFWTLPFPTWSTLVGITSGAVVFTYMIGPVSALAFRRIAPGLHRPMNLKGMHAIALIGFIVGTLLIYWNGWSSDLWIVVGDLVGLVLYFGFLAARPELRKDSAKHIKGGIWLVVFMLFLLAVSYLGSKSFGGQNIIKFPLDMVVAVIGAVVFFYWGNASAFKTEDMERIFEEQEKGELFLQQELHEV
ncbi:MAG: APC family permease [Peptococcaceae bacterium]|nr:APC family permease [Peptococcaceae bacterium]